MTVFPPELTCSLDKIRDIGKYLLRQTSVQKLSLRLILRLLPHAQCNRTFANTTSWSYRGPNRTEEHSSKQVIMNLPTAEELNATMLAVQTVFDFPPLTSSPRESKKREFSIELTGNTGQLILNLHRHHDQLVVSVSPLALPLLTRITLRSPPILITATRLHPRAGPMTTIPTTMTMTATATPTRQPRYSELPGLRWLSPQDVQSREELRRHQGEQVPSSICHVPLSLFL